jgi:D-alanyl-lipoteichoic acid acyltransferase DltB (MBOAT superfamily)
MTFLTTIYFVFIFAGLVVYYVLPKKIRWTVLLAMSYIYYFSFRIKGAIFIAFTTITVYILGRVMEAIQEGSDTYFAQNKENMSKGEKKLYKNKTKKKKRFVLVIAILLNFGMLAAVKYSNLAISGINLVFRYVNIDTQFSIFHFVMPLGISFFTFQAVAYVIDVYQGKSKSEKNFFKFALFVSFFPQLMQGPIGRYDRLAPQLFEGNEYQLKNIQFGLQRIGWGLFKKLLLADRAGVFVGAVFSNSYGVNGALSVAGLLMYSVQLYMDFSGGIDIVIGTAEMFGIKMDENFRQPYFSKSIGEFWRRWHITLGTWMKDYIFYPFSLSKGVNRMTKWGRKHLGTHLGRILPICLANLLIFFIVGIWHGAELRYIAYGLYNGFIIAFSNLLEPAYKKGLQTFRINAESKGWKSFQIFRTFVLINIGWVFDCSIGGLRAAAHTVKVIFTNMDFAQLTGGFISNIGLTSLDYIIIAAGCVVILIVSILKEKNIDIRESLARKPIPVRWLVYYAVFISIIILGYITDNGGFMYAAF